MQRTETTDPDAIVEEWNEVVGMLREMCDKARRQREENAETKLNRPLRETDTFAMKMLFDDNS